MNKTIYCIWSGDNAMSSQREGCFKQFKETCGCNVVLITTKNLHEYILPEHPLHAAYQFLSETHKSDYLRTYLMHFRGGGYSDVKRTTGSWEKSFDDLQNSEYWICGYKEVPGGVGYGDASRWTELLGNGAYICKPGTPLTTEWYNDMIKLLDTKLERLKQFPAKHPQDCGDGYPIEWSEMLGRIFHRVAYTYKDKLLNTLPTSIFINYR